MPNFINLTPEEMETLQRRRVGVQVDMQAYVNFLQEFTSGDYGEVFLNEGEDKRTEKRRLSISATSLGKRLVWVRPLSERILFKIT